MKACIIGALRSTRLLRWADSCRLWWRYSRSIWRNRSFRREYPDFPTPPPYLAFDALNHCDWTLYYQDGLRQAGVFARIILQHVDRPSLNVLEWGCGPGRLIRRMPELLADRQVTLTGSDYNSESIAWCRKHLPGINFVNNQLHPPLRLDTDQFDVVYCFSVFTHLSEPVQIAWANELHRVLAPGGIAIVTTHGHRFRHLLANRREQERFDAGKCVVQGNYREGRKWFLAIHPEPFVHKTLLKPFDPVELVPIQPEGTIVQDVWVAWKPANEPPDAVAPADVTVAEGPA